MLLVILHSCRLQILFKAITSLRHIYNPIRGNPFWILNVKPHGVNVVPAWARETLQLAEAIMVALIQTDARNLSSSPDIIFTMTAFAVGIVIGTKFFVQKHIGMKLLGSADKLFVKLIEHLSEASGASPEHPAHRCAQFIGIVVNTWQRGQKGEIVTDYPLPPLPTSPLPEMTDFNTFHFQSQDQPAETAFNFDLPDIDWLANPNIFQDADVWDRIFGLTPSQ